MLDEPFAVIPSGFLTIIMGKYPTGSLTRTVKCEESEKFMEELFDTQCPIASIHRHTSSLMSDYDE